MVAISFHEVFVDALLRCDKQQTTRLTQRSLKPRIKFRDIAQIYIKQRSTITSKPIRQMTGAGTTVMADRVEDINYHYPAYCPAVEDIKYGDMPSYYAHFIGKVEIAEVYKITPSHMSAEKLNAWALADGFKDFNHAYEWFVQQYDILWMEKTWTVVEWSGWSERYFEPMGCNKCI